MKTFPTAPFRPRRYDERRNLYLWLMNKGEFTYIMTNRNKTVLYTGVTSDLKKRVWEHEHHQFSKSFTDKYNAVYLIYYEWFDDIKSAINREKQIKRWNRAKKEFIINQKNAGWSFLNKEVYDDIYSLTGGRKKEG